MHCFFGNNQGDLEKRWKNGEMRYFNKKLGSGNVGLQDFFCSNKHRCWPRYCMKTLYNTSASCIIIFVYRLLLLSESIYISKGCEVVLQTRAHYKESALSLFFSKISVPLPVFLVEQVLVCRVFCASGVRHALVWCSSLAHVFPPSLSCMHACNHFAAC